MLKLCICYNCLKEKLLKKQNDIDNKKNHFNYKLTTIFTPLTIVTKAKND